MCRRAIHRGNGWQRFPRDRCISDAKQTKFAQVVFTSNSIATHSRAHDYGQDQPCEKKDNESNNDDRHDAGHSECEAASGNRYRSKGPKALSYGQRALPTECGHARKSLAHWHPGAIRSFGRFPCVLPPTKCQAAKGRLWRSRRTQGRGVRRRPRSCLPFISVRHRPTYQRQRRDGQAAGTSSEAL